MITWLAGVLFVVCSAFKVLQRDYTSLWALLIPPGRASYALDHDLPDHPSPVIVTDQRRRSKWTISIPSKLDFPLHPSEYSRICSHAEIVSRHVSDLYYHHQDHGRHAGQYGYYHEDTNFIDVAEAYNHGVFPELPLPDVNGTTCARSLTYVLETSDAGLGSTLLGLWLAYGLAESENRAFFIDDTRFPYGSYSTYFRPPPKPSCLPPAKTEIVPCPHQARHLLVSAATTTWTFGHAFNEFFEDGREVGVGRQKAVFDMLRKGYEAMFTLNEEDQEYVVQRTMDLDSTVRADGGVEIGVQVRHGDRHPLEFQYQRSYIPLSRYVEAAFQLATTRQKDKMHAATVLLLASDDPDVYALPEAKYAQRAQSYISLASKKTLGKAEAKRFDKGLGWEGGFFKDVFWSLGLPPRAHVPNVDGSPNPSKRYLPREPSSSSSTDAMNFHTHPTADALKLRELVGRSYLLDLAVVGQADRVVCGVSSNTCRILAVMMGWEDAIVKGYWKNVDGDFDWRGLQW